MTAVATAPQSVLTSSEKLLHDFRQYGATVGKTASATIKSKAQLSGGAELADAKKTFGSAPPPASTAVSKCDRSRTVKPSVFSATARGMCGIARSCGQPPAFVRVLDGIAL